MDLKNESDSFRSTVHLVYVYTTVQKFKVSKLLKEINSGCITH